MRDKNNKKRVWRRPGGEPDHFFRWNGSRRKEVCRCKEDEAREKEEETKPGGFRGMGKKINHDFIFFILSKTTSFWIKYLIKTMSFWIE